MALPHARGGRTAQVGAVRIGSAATVRIAVRIAVRSVFSGPFRPDCCPARFGPGGWNDKRTFRKGRFSGFRPVGKIPDRTMIFCGTGRPEHRLYLHSGLPRLCCVFVVSLLCLRRAFVVSPPRFCCVSTVPLLCPRCTSAVSLLRFCCVSAVSLPCLCCVSAAPLLCLYCASAVSLPCLCCASAVPDFIEM